MLNLLTYGENNAAPPVLIVHGLFGSGRNWGAVAKRLAKTRRIVSVDMRNHGQSFWADSHTYEDMAADLAEVIDHLGEPADVIGHSMGGKAAMVLALSQPQTVRSLLVADIAPVTYEHTQTQFIKAMRAVDLSRVDKRSDVMMQLAKHLDDTTLQSFFTQSVDLKSRSWRLNLDVLERDMGFVLGFPALTGRYDGPALFLTGAMSDYVLPEHRAEITRLFANARFAKIPGAGHWLHAEKPREFIANAEAWLKNTA